jgi:hypothetical protein
MVITPIPVVWAEMQARAIEYARVGKRPDEEEARSIVASIIREENIIPQPSQEVEQMYASVFLAMIDGLTTDKPHRTARTGSITSLTPRPPTASARRTR